MSAEAQKSSTRWDTEETHRLAEQPRGLLERASPRQAPHLISTVHLNKPPKLPITEVRKLSSLNPQLEKWLHPVSLGFVCKEDG